LLDVNKQMATRSSSTQPSVTAKASRDVYEAAEEAIELVQSLSESKALLGSDPQHAWNQLDAARNNLIRAWDALDAAMKNSSTGSSTKNESNDELHEDRIRVEYMDMITDAFQDVLEDMRQKQGDQLDVDVLIDCLSSGLELLTDQEKLWLLEDVDQSKLDAESRKERDHDLTPHERRRRELGFQVSDETDDE
jgi:hypothetical protein